MFTFYDDILGGYFFYLWVVENKCNTKISENILHCEEITHLTSAYCVVTLKSGERTKAPPLKRKTDSDVFSYLYTGNVDCMNQFTTSKLDILLRVSVTEKCAVYYRLW